MMKVEPYDIAIESRWLYFVLTEKLDHLHNYIIYMFQRKKYDDLFLRLYRNLYIDIWNDRFIVFLHKAAQVSSKKCIECLNYCDEDNNSIVHLMAQYHDKATLSFTLRYFQGHFKIKPNNEGKTPLQLYDESSIKNLLKFEQ